MCLCVCVCYGCLAYNRGALSDIAIHLSVSLSHGQLPRLGMLAACSLATTG